LIYLYGDLMNLYGDRGNIITLQRRCAWRGVDLQITDVSVGDRFDPAAADLFFFGGGQDAEQVVVSQDLTRHTGEAVEEAVNAGAALLSVCGGYQLLGHYFRTGDGADIPGTGLFDAYTVAGPSRNVGNVVAEASIDSSPHPPVGFENHSGRTYLNAPAYSSAELARDATTPLPRVVVGAGNNGQDGFEGACYRGAIGTYLHGPILPKNPWLADRLIMTALRRRTGEPVTLEPLDDGAENAARLAVTERVLRKGNARTSIR
jgi:CobQ-like glutamine amidotransferase family enzyme